MYCCRQSSVHVCVVVVWALSDLTGALFSVADAVMKLYTQFLFLIQSCTLSIVGALPDVPGNTKVCVCVCVFCVGCVYVCVLCVLCVCCVCCVYVCVVHAAVYVYLYPST